MIVIDIIPIDKKKCKIICDEATFALYKGEIRKYNICIDDCIDDNVWNVILEEVLYKRARERALFLLESMERTEYQIYQKLKDGYYPTEIIERVIAFLKDYNYINDKEYAKKYIAIYSNKKSNKCIELDLYRKGINRDVFEKFLFYNEDTETNKILSLLNKKKYNELKDNPKDRNRIINYILRRGYTYEEICKAINAMGNM